MRSNYEYVLVLLGSRHQENREYFAVQLRFLNNLCPWRTCRGILGFQNFKPLEAEKNVEETPMPLGFQHPIRWFFASLDHVIMSFVLLCVYISAVFSEKKKKENKNEISSTNLPRKKNLKNCRRTIFVLSL